MLGISKFCSIAVIASATSCYPLLGMAIAFCSPSLVRMCVSTNKENFVQRHYSQDKSTVHELVSLKNNMTGILLGIGVIASHNIAILPAITIAIVMSIIMVTIHAINTPASSYGRTSTNHNFQSSHNFHPQKQNSLLEELLPSTEQQQQISYSK